MYATNKSPGRCTRLPKTFLRKMWNIWLCMTPATLLLTSLSSDSKSKGRGTIFNELEIIVAFTMTCVMLGCIITCRTRSTRGAVIIWAVMDVLLSPFEVFKTMDVSTLVEPFLNVACIAIGCECYEITLPSLDEISRMIRFKKNASSSKSTTRLGTVLN